MSSDQAPQPAKGLPTIALGGRGAAFSVTWLGDTLLGDGAQPSIDRLGPGWVTERLRPLDADLVVANLEGPITERTEVWDPSQRWTYQSDPNVAAVLSELGVDVGSLANNHAMDRGPGGLADTISNLTGAGIVPLGAGATSAESRLPLLVKTDAGTMAIAAFFDTGSGSGVDRPGVRRLTIENLRSASDVARRGGATWMTAFVHWGVNYEAITERQRRWAGEFATAGYNLVVGTGPHIAQPIELIGNMPVAYSLGNWVFGTAGRYGDRDVPGRGLVLTTQFSPSEQHLRLSVDCIVTDNQVAAYQPMPCTREDAAVTLGALNPAMRIGDDNGTFEVPLTPAPK